MKTRFAILLVVALLAASLPAQERIHLRLHDQNTWWDFPYTTTDVDHFDFSNDAASLRLHTAGGLVVPFAADRMDSITFEDEPSVETKDRYKVFHMYITTQGGAEVTSKEDYLPCYVSLNALGSFSNYSGDAEIRGRGNSSWLWYDKKPYRIKLGSKHKLLGLGKARHWVLLANYRDVTDLMNTFVFEAAAKLGMPFTNHTRYVELFLNGDYKGLYQLTEQVQEGDNRVAISETNGILLSLDLDDGPGLSPSATDNFSSSVFGLPACVKYPKDEALTPARLDSVQRMFAILEQAINRQDFKAADSLMDMRAFIHYLQLQELVENVELVAPRSVYLFKDSAGKWTMGPLWDFDAGYDFDWTNMTVGHNYFADYRELVLGSDPVKRNGYDHNISPFFTNLFGCREFVELYKAEWNAIKATIVPDTWAEMERYVAYMQQGPAARELRRWPISGKNFSDEVRNMHYWLLNRVSYLNKIIDAYPLPAWTEPVTDDRFCGTLTVKTAMLWSAGYAQAVTVNIDATALAAVLGVSPAAFSTQNITSVIPLNADLTAGTNHTNGIYGGWFDQDANPGYFDRGHVYIEVFNDLLHWNCGLQQSLCAHDSHKVTMQIQYRDGSTLKRVNVQVEFTIGR